MINNLYDSWAPHYDSDANPTRDGAATVLRQKLKDLSVETIVELGCGTGVNTAWLADRAESVVAIDFSDGMLEIARQRVPSDDVHFLQHDINKPLPVDPAIADLVVITLVLEHIEAIEPVFGEAARILKQGGELVVCELHPFRQILGKQAHFDDAGTGEQVAIPAFHHDVGDYVRAMVVAGLVVTDLTDWRDGGGSDTSEVPRLLAMRCQKP